MSDNQQKLSLASRRAIERGYDSRGPQWLTEFDVAPLKGDFAYQEGVIRRDPSSVLYIDGLYHCWYTKGEGETLGFNANDPEAKVFPWDLTQVWHATSKDSITWQEQGVAIARGKPGEYDDRAVFTPEVFAHLGKYYLVYQTVETPYTNRQYEHIAIAQADSPLAHGTSQLRQSLAQAKMVCGLGMKTTALPLVKKAVLIAIKYTIRV
ncbi:hypothetical protein P4S68_09600 [Pseudoalteromonas sp. Hal099]